ALERVPAADSGPAPRSPLGSHRGGVWTRDAARNRLVGTARRHTAPLGEHPQRDPERQAHDVAPASLDGLHGAKRLVLDAVGAGPVPTAPRRRLGRALPPRGRTPAG